MLFPTDSLLGRYILKGELQECHLTPRNKNMGHFRFTDSENIPMTFTLRPSLGEYRQHFFSSSKENSHRLAQWNGSGWEGLPGQIGAYINSHRWKVGPGQPWPRVIAICWLLVAIQMFSLVSTLKKIYTDISIKIINHHSICAKSRMNGPF